MVILKAARTLLIPLRQMVTVNGTGGMLRVLGAARKREVKATQNLSVIVLFFMLCWFPLYTINFIKKFKEDFNVPLPLNDFFIILTHLNSAGNPLLYAYHLRDFRAALRSLLIGSPDVKKRIGRDNSAYLHDNDLTENRKDNRNNSSAVLTLNKNKQIVKMISADRFELTPKTPHRIFNLQIDPSVDLIPNNKEKLNKIDYIETKLNYIDESITGERTQKSDLKITLETFTHESPRNVVNNESQSLEQLKNPTLLTYDNNCNSISGCSCFKIKDYVPNTTKKRCSICESIYARRTDVNDNKSLTTINATQSYDNMAFDETCTCGKHQETINNKPETVIGTDCTEPTDDTVATNRITDDNKEPIHESVTNPLPKSSIDSSSDHKITDEISKMLNKKCDLPETDSSPEIKPKKYNDNSLADNTQTYLYTENYCNTNDIKSQDCTTESEDIDNRCLQIASTSNEKLQNEDADECVSIKNNTETDKNIKDLIYTELCETNRTVNTCSEENNKQLSSDKYSSDREGKESNIPSIRTDCEVVIQTTGSDSSNILIDEPNSLTEKGKETNRDSNGTVDIELIDSVSCCEYVSENRDTISHTCVRSDSIVLTNKDFDDDYNIKETQQKS